jgi:DDE superfamily endonuclease
MEDVLDLYEQVYDPKRPVICFDEKPVQLLGETRVARPMSPGRPRRYDYEYERKGTANIFMAVEPLGGWRSVSVTERRTKVDFARQMQELVDIHYPAADCIRVVMDNLNTHKPASLYEAFPPAEALRLLRRLEFHFTPKHANWLNMAEIELSVLGSQCLDRRIAAPALLAQETAAWQLQRNRDGITVKWRFTVQKARTALPHLYPQQS